VHSMEPKPVACRTTSLRELISALSIADLVVCGDGGAMHIAAALGKPIVTMWGSTNPDRWRPWRTPHAILQTESRRAEDISAGTVFNAVEKLFT
ncbi:MAG TPA: glycosyltransferase family 9 protein, partial [Dissulfurispiraceae bacterium]